MEIADVLPSDLVKVKYKGTKANRTAVEALGKMLEAAASDGLHDFQISSAYRTYGEQQQLVDNKVADCRKKNPGWSRPEEPRRWQETAEVLQCRQRCFPPRFPQWPL